MGLPLEDVLEAMDVDVDAATTDAATAKAIAESPTLTQAATNPVFTAVLRNFDFKRSAAEIVAHCACSGVVDIVRCHIRTPQPKTPRKKTAIVSVASRLGLERLLQLDKTHWDKRPLYVRESKDPALAALVHDTLSRRFAAASFHIVPSIETAEMVPPRFSATRDVAFLCNGRSADAFSIEFDAHRVTFKVASVATCSVGTDEAGDTVIWLTLRRAPFVFRSGDTDDNPFSSLFADFGRLLQPSTLWERDASGCKDTGEWVRCVDPSPAKAFGMYLCYQLVLTSSSPSDVLDVLRRMGLEHVAFAEATLPRLPPAPSLRLPESDWSGGFDALLAPLSEAMRYALHVLVSNHVIVLTHAAQVSALVAALLASTVSAAAIMRLAHWRHRRTSSAWRKLLATIEAPPPPPRPDPPSVVRVRRVLVTPLRIVVDVPDLDASNRVLRLYATHLDRFVRATFVDEHYGSVHRVKRDIPHRIASIVRDGLYIAGNHYVFLGYSNAQLRSQSAWFYNAPNDASAPSVAAIHASLGDFLAIPTVGKRGARLGQAFSGTATAVVVPLYETRTVPDIERNGYCFSDGVGTISVALAKTVAHALQLETIPSAFQIRYGGYKGVLSVDPLLCGNVRMALRPSMRKFESSHCALEICSTASRMSCYLNRQLISVLSARGVHDTAFLALYDAMLSSLDACLGSAVAAAQLVATHDPSSPVAKLLAAGVGLDDRYVFEWIGVLRSRLLRNVELKARILVPNGVNLVGVVDETRSLPAHTVFFQTRGETPAFGSTIAVGRCPCLHPGDIQCLTLVDAPALRHLYDVLVFSSAGDRPDPDTMAGGDLDGDVYFCIWDERLLPTTTYPPMEPGVAATPPTSVDPTMNAIGRFYVDYLMNDNLGQIANTHVVLCDLSPHGACDPLALAFASAHAVAVDYAKSGIPASIPKYPPMDVYPDFMDKPDKGVYESTKVLGQLYRRAKTARLYEPTCDAKMLRCLAPGFEMYQADALEMFVDYTSALYDVATRFEVATEAELVSGYVRHLSAKVCRTRGAKASDDTLERLRLAVRRVQQEFTDVFWAEFTEPNDDDLRVLQKASAWYHCAYTYVWPTGHAPYLSFGWLALGPMCHLVRASQ
ncbi:hypothetical protein SDRG_03225 [Saprolegnia diclina VS20]|uniref:RNA-dependent RNA polymerase n=1 Tax=Saprolegnia diclina (strain VS20) TaxID=1156394 RepID=T0SAG4_SAPDV|nr:hypothetical protein SDRG_03225 [Saprolegnia diclina VS20]EQC39802.1 hypothetical protein SDRG_03225 [Saprolegnia diclina VS20]|eukprot:XP_008607074.1 hypothetical protein SDRG_03225 [Saprolegnia diclina VS20]